MVDKKYDFIIVGSGAGGATLARELSRKNQSILILEKGSNEKKLGTFQDSARFYDANKLTKVPKKSKEGVIIWRTIMAGGSTVVSCGNGTRCLEKEFADFGIKLDEELSEVEKETDVKPFAEELLSEGSKRIMEASKELGYRMELMPKFIQREKCVNCGQCSFGCAREAKWTALNYLDEAVHFGAKVLYNTPVEKILQEKGKLKGVKGFSRNGENEFLADVVILAAGGLGTPVILQKSGINNAGKGLFMDLLINTYGITDGLNQINEPTMALVDHEFHKEKGFILSTFVNHHRMVRFMELGPKGLSLPLNRMLGIMTKTADDSVGYIDSNGKVSKTATENDWKRLNEGTSIAKEILIKAGAHPNSILFSKVQGAHPGGTAALGKIVGTDLQTEIENLYVCDASVFPRSPGMPPILTVCALAKKLAKNLTS